MTGEMHKRACRLYQDGAREFEVALTATDGCHIRPTVHFHQDMCQGSFLASMCLTTTTHRGTTNSDRFHRRMNDKFEAVAASGLPVIKLEVASCSSLRRKPFNRDGNHRILLQMADDMYERLNHLSELWAIFYPRVCEDLGEYDSPDFGTDEHMGEVFGY